MHIPDGFLNDAVSFGLGAGALGALAHATSKVRKEVKVKVALLQQKMAGAGGDFKNGARRWAVSFANNKVQNMALLGSLIFALQMINFPVQNGTSGHLIGAVLAMAVVGPYAALLVMAVVVAIQAVFFADGGLLALGANIINMGLVPVIAGILIFQLAKRKNRTGTLRALTLFAAAWFSVVSAATACSLELALSGTIALQPVLTNMVPVHALIGLGEGMLSVAVFFLFFAEDSSYLLVSPGETDEK